MPEGPEVRHNAELLSRLIAGVKVTGVITVPGGKLSRKGVPGAGEFKPATVKTVAPRGKLMVVSFDNGSALTSSLGMSGWWYPGSLEQAAKLYNERAYQQGKLVLATDVIQQAYRYERVTLIGSDGQTLARFCDMRNFGNMEYYPQGLSEDKLKERIGLDLLNELPTMLDNMDMTRYHLLTLKDFAPKRLQRMKLGDLALEQSFIAGLGNIYRAETLWLSGIDPYRRLEQLDEHEWLKFCEVAMTVLKIAYRTAGVMLYTADVLSTCTGQPVTKDCHGHLIYGKAADLFGRPVICDDSFARPLWRLA